MTSNEKRPLDARAVVSVAAALAALGLPFTGYANHILQTAPMTAGRHAWMAAHFGLGLLFMIFGAWHAVLNRRALVRHIGRIAHQVPCVRREALVAAVVVAAGMFLFVGHALVAR